MFNENMFNEKKYRDEFYYASLARHWGTKYQVRESWLYGIINILPWEATLSFHFIVKNVFLNLYSNFKQNVNFIGNVSNPENTNFLQSRIFVTNLGTSKMAGKWKH